MPYVGDDPNEPGANEQVIADIDDLNEKARAGLNGDVQTLLELATKAHELAVTAGYERGIAQSLRSLAAWRYLTGDYTGAIELNGQASCLARSTGDRSLEMSLLHQRALIHLNLAVRLNCSSL